MKKFLSLHPRRGLLLFLTLFTAVYSIIDKPSLKSFIWSDAEGYYLYLPAVFIYHGFETVPVRTEGGQFPKYERTNKRFTKYSCGVAMMQLPFFLTAHLFSKIFGLPADGYSPIYAVSVWLAGIFYCFFGLFILVESLKRYFSVRSAMLTAAALYLGTNLLHYTVSAPGMSHVYSFFLFSVLVYFIPRFYDNPSVRNTTVIAVVTGLAVLIRYTNALILIYFLLYNIYSFSDFKNRIFFLSRNLKKLLLFPVALFVFFIPQMIYWKYISGRFWMYSYGDEGFRWLRPEIFKIFFDVQNGWLIYSPMMLFSVAGLFLLLYKKKLSSPGIFFTLTAASYVFASWWAWWFGGAFGHRCFVEYYALLSVPLAFSIQYVSQLKKPVISVCFYFLLIVFSYYNVGMNVLYRSPWDGPDWTWESYWKVVERLI